MNSSCEADSRAGSAHPPALQTSKQERRYCVLSESAPCLCPSLQPLHTGDCGAIFMGRIIFLFSYAENDQTSEPG